MMVSLADAEAAKDLAEQCVRREFSRDARQVLLGQSEIFCKQFKHLRIGRGGNEVVVRCRKRLKVSRTGKKDPLPVRLPARDFQ
jgi:hypothetical protein